MRILVLGLDSPLGYSLRSFAAPLMRHEIIGVEMDATRWRRERQVKKLIRRQPIAVSYTHLTLPTILLV